MSESVPGSESNTTTESPVLLCNEAYGARLSETVPWAATAAGVLVASYSGGLRHIDASGCVSDDVLADSSTHPSFADSPILDVTWAGDTLYAVSSPSQAGPGSLLASRDEGKSFEKIADVVNFATALRVTPGPNSRVYVSGMNLEASGSSTAELLVSDDGGESFVARPIPLESEEIRARILSVSPASPDLVFVATQGPNADSAERLLVSHDAGQNFTEAFRGKGPLVLSSDDSGHAHWLGGADGLYHADEDLNFSVVTSELTRIGCVEFRAGALHVCATHNSVSGVFLVRDASQPGGSALVQGHAPEFTVRPWLLFTQVERAAMCSNTDGQEASCEASFADFVSEQQAISDYLPQSSDLDSDLPMSPQTDVEAGAPSFARARGGSSCSLSPSAQSPAAPSLTAFMTTSSFLLLSLIKRVKRARRARLEKPQESKPSNLRQRKLARAN